MDAVRPEAAIFAAAHALASAPVPSCRAHASGLARSTCHPSGATIAVRELVRGVPVSMGKVRGKDVQTGQLADKPPGSH